MRIKAIITGSTGMIGKALLLECLESPDVESVLAINRQPVELQHEKLTEIIHQDFFDLSSLKERLTGFNTCYFCLGISAAGLSEDKYSRITYELTMNFARTVLPLNPGIVFCYISAAGADSSEKGRIMWARVKGKTENALLAMPFKRAYMFRPGFIQPMKGVRSRTSLYNAIYAVLKYLYPLLKGLPQYVTSSDRLGQAMLKAVLKGYDQPILESRDINLLAAK